MLRVRVLSSKENYYIEGVASVTGVNSAGIFDVLPGHAKFVTYVDKGPLSVKLADGTEKKLDFELAILHVHEDEVDIFINPTEVSSQLK